MASAISSSTTRAVTNPPRRAARTATALSVPAASPIRTGIRARVSKEMPTSRRFSDPEKILPSASICRPQTVPTAPARTSARDSSSVERAAPHQGADCGQVGPDPEKRDSRLRAALQRLRDAGLPHQHVPKLDALHDDRRLDDPVAAGQLFRELLCQPEPVDLGIARPQPAMELDYLHALERKGPHMAD